MELPTSPELLDSELELLNAEDLFHIISRDLEQHTLGLRYGFVLVTRWRFRDRDLLRTVGAAAVLSRWGVLWYHLLHLEIELPLGVHEHVLTEDLTRLQEADTKTFRSTRGRL